MRLTLFRNEQHILNENFVQPKSIRTDNISFETHEKCRLLKQAKVE